MSDNPYRPQRITVALINALVKQGPLHDFPKEIRDKSAGLILRHQPSGYLGLYAELGYGKRERVCDARTIIDNSHDQTLGMAKERARILRGEAAGGRDFKGERQAKRGVPTLAEYLDKSRPDSYAWFIENDPDHRSADKTLARLRSSFLKPFGRRRLDNIKPKDVDAWRVKRAREVTRETVNRDLSSLRAALNKAVAWRLIPDNPLRGYQLLTVDPHKKSLRPVTDDEITALRDALAAREDRIRMERASGNRWRAERGYVLLPSLEAQYVDALLPAVELSLATGMRRGELLALTWDHVHLKRHTVNVAGETTKSYATREIPLNDHVVSILRKWNLQHGRPTSGYVFPGAAGHVANLKKSFYATLEAAGIERVTAHGRVTWHSMRHTFGSRLGAAGVDPQTLKELMGHADLKTTQRYLRSDAERRRAAVEQLDAKV